MSRARELFERLRKNGFTALEELIADREPESLFLDFKRSPDDGLGKNLATEDNKNLSKAISGFANSSGGVIIWGVDCRRDVSGNETATLHPLNDAGGFCTKLQSAVSRTTVPPHPGVEVHFFHETSTSPRGYVVVHIPQSQIGPIRSTLSHHYHMRTGSNFEVVPHDVLAGMFGRTPQPNVGLNIVSNLAKFVDHADYISFSIGLLLVNLGAIVGERPFLSCNHRELQSDRIRIDTPDPTSFSVRRSDFAYFNITSPPGFLLVPGAVEHICTIDIQVPVRAPHGIKIDLVLGVLHAPPKKFTLEASEANVRAGIAAGRGLTSFAIFTLGSSE